MRFHIPDYTLYFLKAYHTNRKKILQLAQSKEKMISGRKM
jgi:hypothetical protein